MEAEQERQAQEKEYEEVISQRDILGTQLIRRNDELALLYEKARPDAQRRSALPTAQLHTNAWHVCFWKLVSGILRPLLSK